MLEITNIGKGNPKMKATWGPSYWNIENQLINRHLHWFRWDP
jgi:hypothetical protein